tara:strand:- start:2842 stop:3399 length:558 start_codon:yes stop_codon:yes gene_type:complete
MYLYPKAKEVLPNFDGKGSIYKACVCFDPEKNLDGLIEGLTNLVGPTPPIIRMGPAGFGQPGSTGRIGGFMVTMVDCPCDHPTPTSTVCDGWYSGNIFQPGGERLDTWGPNRGEPFQWVTSTGQVRSLPSWASKKDVLQDILDWEMSHPLDCCGKGDKSGGGSGTSVSQDATQFSTIKQNLFGNN